MYYSPATSAYQGVSVHNVTCFYRNVTYLRLSNWCLKSSSMAGADGEKKPVLEMVRDYISMEARNI